LVTGVWESIDQLRKEALLDAEEAAFFQASYTFLRGIEARLRLMNTELRHDFPLDYLVASKLAFLMHYDDPAELREVCLSYLRKNRELFLRIVERLR
jgi:glutamate-ammonia-ligase adenylyltransferase